MQNDQSQFPVVAAANSEPLELQTFEQGLVDFIGSHGLPTEKVLVSVSERQRVFGNVEHVLNKLDHARREKSVYISKFLAAAASGLFDAALNYLWDETIFELRSRVAQYDLNYFFDIAVKDPDRRKKLKDASDLPRVEDSELIKAANELGLVSDLGFKHLDFIRFMRNWVSAAHPNQNEITGLQLIAWLETCVNEVINLPQSTIVGEIKRILANIKANVLTTTEANSISLFFGNLDKERVNALARGFFGIYIDPASTSQVRQNIHLLAPRLWPQVDEYTRGQFGIRYAQYAASGEQERKDLARQFLDQVGGLAYIPDDLRAAEIQTALQDLLTAHHAPLNNFYNEPPFARRLAALMKPPAKLPDIIAEEYVLTLVEVFLSNGNGVAWNADSVYSLLLSQLTAPHALIALLSFQNTVIASRLQFPVCQGKFRELLTIVRRIITAPAAIDLIDDIEKFTGPLYQLSADSNIKRKIQSLKTILGLQ
jgi:hypothetical protein